MGMALSGESISSFWALEWHAHRDRENAYRDLRAEAIARDQELLAFAIELLFKIGLFASLWTPKECKTKWRRQGTMSAVKVIGVLVGPKPGFDLT